MQENWFTSWFASPYYHKLYNHRDEKEAADFLDKLTDYLKPDNKTRVLDAGCGYGRHAKYLSQKGFNVCGIDINKENIEFASKFENENLKFRVQDMRELFSDKADFDLVLNLFTSFGYFKNDSDNQKTISNFSAVLKKGGKLIIDFINAKKAISELQPFEVVEKEELKFNISKFVDNGFIIKNIRFSDNGQEYAFQEYVRALVLDDFKIYFEKASLVVKDVFGSYDLKEFDPDTSNRLIMITEKKIND